MKLARSSLAVFGILAASACASSYADSSPVLARVPDSDVPAADRRACTPYQSPTSYSPYGADIWGGDAEALPAFRYGSRTYVMGTIGERYVIHLTNRTSRRVEAVVSVDGLDAIDGRAADYQGKRGYLVPAYGEITVEGFRTSLEQVAAFRFSSVADSFAGRKGQARDVGVIGVAFFPERELRVMRPAPPYPYAERAPSAAPAAPTARDGAAAGEASSAEAPRERAEKRSDDERRSRPIDRPGLGTEFGEQRGSSVQYTSFQRQSPNHPASLVEIRYNDRRGLLALGVPVDGCSDDDVALRETARPFRGNGFATPPPPR
jgi:hypothetical protein